MRAQLQNQYTKEMAGKYTPQMPSFSQWLAQRQQGKAAGGSVLPAAERKANLAKFLKPSQHKTPVYHGTADTQIHEFKGNRGVAAHFGFEPEVADQWASARHQDVEDLRHAGDIEPDEEAGGMVYPAHIQVKNIFDVRKPEHHKLIPQLHQEIKNGRDIGFTELESAIDDIKKQGFDSYYDFENGHLSDKKPSGIAIFRPHQIKSALGNRGTYDIKEADITKAKGGSVEPKKTVKAYKLFRVHPNHPGKLFPLFVDSNTPVEMNKWVDAKEGEMANGKVKSKIGALAYRPGWHAGDLPIATHIGEKSDPTLTAPDTRPANHAWAEVDMPDDKDWQSEANKRGTNAQGKLVPVKAHITDQIPKGGHYRYKTNPNMTGNWLIGGSMKVNKVLTDAEVARINKAAGMSDLPRAEPFKKKAFGFANGGVVGPEEWQAEEHVNHLPAKKRDENKAKFLEPSKVKDRMYHATSHDFNEFKNNANGIHFVTPSAKWAHKFLSENGGMPPNPLIMPVHVQAKNPFDFENLTHLHKLKPKLSSHWHPNIESFERAVDEGRNIQDSWSFMESPDVQNAIKDMGHDSFYVSESGMKNLGIFDPRKIKSATGNRGTYDTTKADITKARGGRVTHAHHLEIEERPL